MKHTHPHEIYADDATENVSLLVRLRLPWLIIGLLGGLVISIVMARFERIIAEHVSIAFFLPLIVYMSSAVGTQTATIFVRNMAKKRVNFGVYLVKEFAIGLLLGLLFGLALGLFAFYWLDDFEVALSVATAMFLNVSAAPLIALLVPLILSREHTDPAVGSGPVETVLQDFVSILIYFLIASAILL